MVIFVMGPTAAGKSDVALALARRLDGEIVSVDSAQVYRGLDIGSAKPSAEAQAEIPHHLLDIIDPAEAYSAARFAEDAARAVASIRRRGRVPILAGGTGLYFDALEHGLAPLPSADPELRRRIAEEAAESGWPALHRRLRDVDPETAGRVHPNDAQRIQRALEVYTLTGFPLSRVQRRRSVSLLDGPPLKLILGPPSRAWLQERIEARFHAMLAAGLVEEVAALRRRGDLSPELPAVRAVGYRQVWGYLEGKYDYPEMVRRGIVATRRYAKRQLTWLRRNGEGHWIIAGEAAIQQASALMDGVCASRRNPL